MGIATIIAAAGVLVSGAGVATQYIASQKSAKLQQEAEAQRRQQMELDAQRRKREVIRQQLLARGTALSNATNQGAAGGSGLQGGYGSIAGRTGVNELGINQNLEIGRSISNTNSELASSYATQAIGAGMTSLGEGILRNEGAYNRVGTYFSSFFGSRAGGQGAYA